MTLRCREISRTTKVSQRLSILSPERLKQIRRTRANTAVAVALVAAVIISLLFSVGFYSHIQIRLSDFLYGGTQALDNIAIVAIDDRSIQEIGRWPWDRGNFTEVMGYVGSADVVGFDVGFFEPSEEDADAKLAYAVKHAGNVVMPVEYTDFDVRGDTIRGTSVAAPFPAVYRAASDMGYINVITDQDGITRAVNLAVEGEFDPFSYIIMQKYLSKPVEKDNRVLINFVGPPGSFREYSFVDVVRGEYGRSEFEGRIVLIGSTAPDLHDDYFVPTSYGKAMPGVEIHANLIQQMIAGKGVKVAPWWLTVLLIFIVAVGVALAVIYLPVWLAAALSVAATIVYTFIAIYVFDAGIILNLIYIPGAIVATYLVGMIYFYVSEKKDRKKVLGAFEKYVSKDVISHILEHPDRLQLGGEKRTITVFFSDIRGFTTISEKLTPHQLVQLLNEYLSEMTAIILKYNGVVDKYMGDAIMAFWNAPLDQPKHAERAALASLEMEARLKELQEKWKKAGVPQLDIGIGLNTGPAVVGNMGSYDRFDYTAMGDTVNLGSRLEGINKPYGTRIIISETTREKLPKGFVTRKLDLVQVKGKKEPITIYELVAKKADAEAWYDDVIEHFEKGLVHYFRQKWGPAMKEFAKADSLRKKHSKEHDGPSKAFFERCEYFRKHSPGKSWDGVWVMKTK
ncbi:CHASE2 domain-containing protein [Candidatus Woesearchaeota archaeon]|nr:CHASE2 domain-containing protein [Candidatus Woesearchaeota archaeon]